jgi:hypothetical protein
MYTATDQDVIIIQTLRRCLICKGKGKLKSNPGPPRWGLDTGLATPFRKNKFCCEISVKYSRLDMWKMNHAK